MLRRHARPTTRHNIPRSPARRLVEAERLFADFADLTPYRFRPFARTFQSFAAYERWKRAQAVARKPITIVGDNPRVDILTVARQGSLNPIERFRDAVLRVV